MSQPVGTSCPHRADAMSVPFVEYLPGVPRLAFERAGTGESIVFLHGIGGNRHNWRSQIAHFRLRFQAVAWDARGYGASDDYSGPLEFRNFSEDLVRLLDALEVERAHMVGLSMGGRILMDFGARFPDRVSSLVIACAFPSFTGGLSQAQQKEFQRLRKERIQRGEPLAEIAPSLCASLLGPAASEDARQAVLESILALHPASYLKALEAAETFDRTVEITRIQAPTLLMYGELDRLVTPLLGKEVNALMPKADYDVIGGVGHLINIEQPSEFNSRVERFIRHHARSIGAETTDIKESRC